jgi:hypothetical protein
MQNSLGPLEGKDKSSWKHSKHAIIMQNTIRPLKGKGESSLPNIELRIATHYQ